MCGILGIISPDVVDVRAGAAALQRIRHRGPDDEGLLLADWRTGAAAPALGADSDRRLPLPTWQQVAERPWNMVLGHRRLSILDLSPAGHQPMSWAGGRYWITYNGEVYNYLELRQELEAGGAQFVSGSDTEVLLAAYERWGADCVKRFTGMWAFCIWDVARKELFFSRDPFGIKPLYYTTAGGGLSFCSEIKGLLGLPGVKAKLDPRGAYDYLAWGMTERPHGGTMLAGIHEMPPATRATVRLEGTLALRPEKYWDVEIGAPRRVSLTDAAAEYSSLFQESIRLHLRADVPVGAALSGGIDSTAIVCAMREAGGPALDLHTFSFIADDARLSEEQWMDRAGAAAGARMHKVAPGGAEMATDLETLIACQDLPFGSTSIYAQHRVFRTVRDAGIKVTLDGQGPDEMFAGYFHFRRDRALSLIGKGNVRAGLRMAALSGARSPLKVLGQALAPRALTPTLRRVFGRNAVPAWLRRHWLEQQGVPCAFPDREHPRREALRQSLRRALLENGIPSLLRYEDRNSMHYSIESRVPFLTTRLAEFALKLPEEHLIAPDGTTKFLLRTAFRGLMPDAILDRRDKIGFATPEGAWLRQRPDWVRRITDSDTARALPLLEPAGVSARVEQFLSGQSSSDPAVWWLINFITWAKANDVTA